MSLENMQFGLANVTKEGVLFKNSIYTSPRMVKYGWFILAGKNGSWQIPILYNLSDKDHILLLDTESLETATAIVPTVTLPQNIIKAYHEAMSNLKDQLRESKQGKKGHSS